MGMILAPAWTAPPAYQSEQAHLVLRLAVMDIPGTMRLLPSARSAMHSRAVETANECVTHAAIAATMSPDMFF
jgi:hypothetical protein